MTVLALASPLLGLFLMLALQRLEVWLAQSIAERPKPVLHRRLAYVEATPVYAVAGRRAAKGIVANAAVARPEARPVQLGRRHAA